MSTTKVTGMMQTSTKGGDISSASPCVIDTDGDYFDVSGTTNFAAFTVVAGRRFTIQFDGVLTMTHHATNLDLPGGANITTAAGDVGEFFATGTNTVQCINYTKADGTAVVAAAGGAWNFISSGTASASSSIDFTTNIDSTYDVYMFYFVDFEFSADCSPRVRVGAGSFDSGSTDYQYAYGGNHAPAAVHAACSGGAAFMGFGEGTWQDGSSGGSATIRIMLYAPSDTTHKKNLEYTISGQSSNGYALHGEGVGQRVATSAITRLQLYPSTGTITSGTFYMYGLSKS
jgi:hypothetical protein